MTGETIAVLSPVEMAHADERRRFAWLFGTAVVASYVAAVGVLLAGNGGQCLFDALIGSIILAVRQWALAGRQERISWGTHLFAAVALIAIISNALTTGQSSSFALWYLITLPLATVFLSGPRGATGWAVICVLTVVGMGVSKHLLPLPVSFVPGPGMVALTQIIMITVCAVYGIVARRSSDVHIEELDVAYRELLAQKEIVARQAEVLSKSLLAEQEAKQMAEQARQAAEQANNAKSGFLATISHEIRTPLSGVIGLNSLLLDTSLTDAQRHYADLARLSGENLLHLINDLLDFSKIEAGRFELEPLDFNPGQLLDELLSLVRVGVSDKGLQLHADINVPQGLRGDAARLRQILLNLLNNAIKFTEHGSITLRVFPIPDMNGVSASTLRLRFEIIDTGIGIDSNAQRRLFQPFTQADISTTRRFGGTGLGLAICRALADLMQGQIGISSAPGQGSTFWVELPFEHAEVPMVEAEAPRQPTLRLGRVLLVEDNTVNQFVATEVLKRLNCQVDVAANGKEAIDALHRKNYDLLFMDCDMPVMDGFEASRLIRAEEEGGLRHVTIIAMTASALKGDRERCLDAGMDDYLSKPARLGDFRQILLTWLPVGQAVGEDA